MRFLLAGQLCWEMVIIEAIASVRKYHFLIDYLLYSGPEWCLPDLCFLGWTGTVLLSHISKKLSSQCDAGRQLHRDTLLHQNVSVAKRYIVLKVM